MTQPAHTANATGMTHSLNPPDFCSFIFSPDRKRVDPRAWAAPSVFPAVLSRSAMRRCQKQKIQLNCRVLPAIRTTPGIWYSDPFSKYVRGGYGGGAKLRRHILVDCDANLTALRRVRAGSPGGSAAVPGIRAWSRTLSSCPEQPDGRSPDLRRTRCSVRCLFHEVPSPSGRS